MEAGGGGRRGARGGGGWRGGGRRGARGAGRHAHTPNTRPWGRKWTLYAPPGSANGGVPTAPVTFRVLSFNVLADYITMKDAAEKAAELWKLEWSYRRMRLVKEILAWRPHVVCLQEVDHFQDFFEPELRKAGYNGIFKKRTGQETHDGCATFVLSSCMAIVASHALEFFTPGHAVLDRHNVAQQAIVEWTPSDAVDAVPKRFVVANTHLLFNPGRGDVKLAQLQSLFESLTVLRANANDNTLLPVVLCGDFNLAPHGALYEFISRGSLDVSGLSKHLLSGQSMDDHQKRIMFTNEQDYCRHHGHGTTMGRFTDRYAVRRYFHHFPRDTIASHTLPLASAYAQAPTQDCTGEPKFTTFHDGSKGTVDYIWFTTDTAHCHGVVEMVPAGQLFHARSLPTEHHASDHLPLIADFSLA